mgnify:CR=1 FL=1
MDNVNDIIDMLKDRLVEATRKTNRVKADVFGDDTLHYTYAELYEAMELEEQLRSILFAITGRDLSWSEDDQTFLEGEYTKY